MLHRRLDRFPFSQLVWLRLELGLRLALRLGLRLALRLGLRLGLTLGQGLGLTLGLALVLGPYPAPYIHARDSFPDALTWSSPRAAFRFVLSGESHFLDTWSGRMLLERLDYLGAAVDGSLHNAAKRTSVEFVTDSHDDRTQEETDSNTLIVPITPQATAEPLLTKDRGASESGMATPSVDRSAQWSPDGEWVLGRSWMGGNPFLWLEHQQGGYRRQVTGGHGFVEAAAWSPDSSAVAYLEDGQLWTCSIHGLVSTRMPMLDRGDRVTAYAWSPSSQQLAVALSRSSTDGRLLVIDRENGPATHYVSLPGRTAASPILDWSPDGQRLFLRCETEAWLYTVPQKYWQRFSLPDGPVTSVVWAPGGQGLALAVATSETNTRIIAFSSAGKRLREWKAPKGGVVPVAMTWRPLRVLMADPVEGRLNTLETAGGARPLKPLRGLRLAAVLPSREPSAVVAFAQARNAWSDSTAAWVLALAPDSPSATQKALAAFALKEYEPLALGSYGWSTSALPLERPPKLVVVPAVERDLARLTARLRADKAISVDFGPHSSSFAVIAADSGRLAFRKIPWRDGLFGTGRHAAFLSPPKRAGGPPWVWPAVITGLLVLTFLAGLFLTYRRIRP